MSATLRYSALLKLTLNAKLLAASPVYGGSINSCFLLETDKGNFFLKENDTHVFPGMFEAEKKGLTVLKKANAFSIPEVISIHEQNGFSMLLMEWLEKKESAQDKMAWHNAGKKLALLHKNTAASFGLDHHNYIGSLAQRNSQHATWPGFFSPERILPQLKLAFDDKKIDAVLLKKGENFCTALEEIFPLEAPSLLHGDLWSGNFFFSKKGPAIFDPAVYYGHREMDLGMTKLFGGFDPAFYDGYQDEFPLEKNWKSRTDFCNLYPLLVHVNLFGGSYVEDVKGVLQKF
ncbi:fructosamine kinase family protein [soil metagenome]